MRPWQRAVPCFLITASAFVIVSAEFLRGSELYGALHGLVLVGGTIDWVFRARSDPAAGFDPLVVMYLALLMMTPRFKAVAAWLGIDG
jgi:hypothetical protein